jgi:penicillin-binding protein 2
MPQDRIYEDLSLLFRRARTVFWVVAGLTFFALSYYWKLQILDHQAYEKMAEANRSRMRVLAAPRGLIRDRTNGILADNEASFKVSLIRENVKNEAVSYPMIGRLLGLDESTLRARLDLHRDLPLFEPIVIADGLGPNDIAPVESRRLEFPELVVEAEPRRIYPGGTLAAHILGYLQEPSAEEIRARPDRKVRPGELVGKSGVEREYDDVLKGQDGSVYEVVNSLGRTVEEGGHVYPIQGHDLRLTIDRGLQAEAERALEGREGVIVALEADTGNILALASFPTFDPNKFITRFTPQEWLALQSDPLSPLENRSIRGLYAPGSIFKLVMGLGGLGFGFVAEGTTVYCSGATEIYGAVRHCWFAPGHGAMDLANAIKNSCNIYFYSLGRRMTIDQIALAAGRLGLGRKTGLDLAGEKEGLVPSADWKKKAFNAPWYPGETISVAIGQGQLQVTPMQIAAMTARIANRGHAVRPRLVDTGPPALPPGEPPAPGPGEPPAFGKTTYEAVIAGMWRSVNDGGTGQGAIVAGFDVCGKTGSTQTMSRENAERLARAGHPIKTHSWFSGFAPRDKPKIVVTVLVEFGGGGGATAAPVAGRIFDLYKQELNGK